MSENTIIVGGGLAGAATAILLAKANRPVTLFERDALPADKICGEFLGPGAQFHLRRLGLDLASLGAQPITQMRLVRNDRVVETPLPFPALGLSRRVLDAALLGHAAAAGATVRRGQPITILNDPRSLHLEAGTEEIAATTLFLASGKHDLRALRRTPRETPEDLVGFKTYFRLTAEQQRSLTGAIELILLPDGYAGLQMVEGNRANLCLLVARARLQRAGGNWPTLLGDLQSTSPHLRLRLTSATDLLDHPLTIFRVPYGYVHVAPASPGLFRLGDQMGVIPSFAGDGMAIALHSAAVATAVHLSGQDSAHYQRRIANDIARQIGRAHRLYRLARRPPGQAAMMAAARFWPGLLRRAALATRVPQAALIASAD